MCFVAGIFTADCLYKLQRASTTAMLLHFFFEFGVVIVEYFVYKRVFGFPPFCLYYFFMKLFLFQSKTKNAVNDINQNFTSNNLNKKKSEHPFLKKLIFEHLTLSMISFESFMRRWSSSK